MEKIKFGCHHFLNSSPILAPLKEKKLANLKIVHDSPARLAAMLKNDELHLSFIPSVEYADRSDYLLVNGISISSFKQVDTVLLISKTKMEDIRTVAVDNRSKSSIALLKIIFMEKCGRLPTLNSMPPNPASMLLMNDAALIIGDEAFAAIQQNGLSIFDLSREWFKITAKPFVHAVLCARGNVDFNTEYTCLVKEILNSRDQALDNVEYIAKEAATEFGIAEDICIDYIKNKIVYSLGKSEQEGLNEFFFLANKFGLIDRVPELKFL